MLSCVQTCLVGAALACASCGGGLIQGGNASGANAGSSAGGDGSCGDPMFCNSQCGPGLTDACGIAHTALPIADQNLIATASATPALACRFRCRTGAQDVAARLKTIVVTTSIAERVRPAFARLDPAVAACQPISRTRAEASPAACRKTIAGRRCSAGLVPRRKFAGTSTAATRLRLPAEASAGRFRATVGSFSRAVAASDATQTCCSEQERVVRARSARNPRAGGDAESSRRKDIFVTGSVRL